MSTDLSRQEIFSGGAESFIFVFFRVIVSPCFSALNSASRAAFKAVAPRPRFLSEWPLWWISKTVHAYRTLRWSSAATNRPISWVAFSSPGPKFRATVSMIINSGFPSRETISSMAIWTDRADCSSRNCAGIFEMNKDTPLIETLLCFSQADSLRRKPLCPSPATKITLPFLTWRPWNGVPVATHAAISMPIKDFPHCGSPKIWASESVSRIPSTTNSGSFETRSEARTRGNLLFCVSAFPVLKLSVMLFFWPHPLSRAVEISFSRSGSVAPKLQNCAHFRVISKSDQPRPTSDAVTLRMLMCQLPVIFDASSISSIMASVRAW